MQDITGAKKEKNGIVVEFREEAGYGVIAFTFSELIDMRINALDLLDRPQNYAVDTENRRVVEKIP